MELKTFLSATVPQLAELTRTNQEIWKHHLYKGGSSPREKFLRQASQNLGMSVEELKAAMETRKKEIALKKQARQTINQFIDNN